MLGLARRLWVDLLTTTNPKELPMMKSILASLMILCFVGCSGNKTGSLQTQSQPQQVHQQEEDVEGVHEAEEPQIAIGCFVDYYDCEIRVVVQGDRAVASWPLYGTREVVLVKGDWNYGDAGEWRGSFEADGKTWSVRLTIDVYGTMMVALTDGGTNGESDTIVWRCVPVRAG